MRMFGALLLLNSGIGFLASFGLGQASRAKQEMNKMLSNIKDLNTKKLDIYLYLQTNCTKLFDLYPELVYLRNMIFVRIKNILYC